MLAEAHAEHKFPISDPALDGRVAESPVLSGKQTGWQSLPPRARKKKNASYPIPFSLFFAFFQNFFLTYFLKPLCKRRLFQKITFSYNVGAFRCCSQKGKKKKKCFQPLAFFPYWVTVVRGGSRWQAGKGGGGGGSTVEIAIPSFLTNKGAFVSCELLLDEFKDNRENTALCHRLSQLWRGLQAERVQRIFSIY